MKALFDFLPLILFFVANKFYGIYVATAVLIIVTFIQVGLFYFKNKRLEKMHIIMLVAVAIFGGLTIGLRDPVFLKWKVSIVNWLFAAIIIGSILIKKSVIKALMGNQISMPAKVWARLSLAWAVFFVIVGFINMYIAFYYRLDLPEEVRLETWVDFKVFGVLGLTFIFVIIQTLFIAKYIDPDSLEKNGDEKDA